MMSIADIHARGAESTAQGTPRVVGAMWTSLTNLINRGLTSAVKSEMMKLKAPAISRKAGQDEDFDPNDADSDGKLPSERDLGRALVISRSGVFPPRPS
jgi:hypothetical protein